MHSFTKRKTTTHIAIHCSATRPSQDIGAKEIDSWHRAKGWNGIGYHYVIRRCGAVELGRPDDTIGAHVSGHNDTSIGICMAGGVTEKDVNKPSDNFTSHQYFALRNLLKELVVKYPNVIIQGHRDFPHVAKACPSFDVATWLKEVQL